MYLTEEQKNALSKAGMTVNAFFAAYVECALWSSVDEYGNGLSEHYDSGSIEPETLVKMAEDCARFQNENKDSLSMFDDSQSGHDFWLTRNGHGSGFWDRRGKNAVEEKALTQLAEASCHYGSFDLHVGDDNTIFGE